MTDPAAYRRWLDDVIQRHRQLGFFVHGEYAGLAGAALREAVVGDHDRWFQDGYFAACRQPLALPALERLVVTRDRWRIWDTDPEQVYQEGAFYARGLQALARISNGAFAPAATAEQWLETPDPRRPVIFLDIALPDGAQRLWMRRRGDFATRSFVAALSTRLPAGLEFWFITALDWAVLMLDTPALATLRQWGWILEPPESHGVLADPELEPATAGDGELYMQRGLWRHAHGDFAGAYGDWAVARDLGVEDLHRRMPG